MQRRPATMQERHTNKPTDKQTSKQANNADKQASKNTHIYIPWASAAPLNWVVLNAPVKLVGLCCCMKCRRDLIAQHGSSGHDIHNTGSEWFKNERSLGYVRLG